MPVAINKPIVISSIAELTALASSLSADVLPNKEWFSKLREFGGEISGAVDVTPVKFEDYTFYLVPIWLASICSAMGKTPFVFWSKLVSPISRNTDAQRTIEAVSALDDKTQLNVLAVAINEASKA